jgi:hypothetical protein
VAGLAVLAATAAVGRAMPLGAAEAPATSANSPYRSSEIGPASSSRATSSLTTVGYFHGQVRLLHPTY